MVKIGDIELGEFPLLLAPMEDVSDPPFRMVCKQYGADLMYTEFISSEGLIRNAQKSIQKLDISDLVNAQIHDISPDYIRKKAEKGYRFDRIDDYVDLKIQQMSRRPR